MTDHPVLAALADDSFRAEGIAAAMMLLIKDGFVLGEMREVDVQNGDGTLRKAKRLPELWLQRLVRAAEVGAFERMTIRQIVDRILAPPLPEPVD